MHIHRRRDSLVSHEAEGQDPVKGSEHPSSSAHEGARPRGEGGGKQRWRQEEAREPGREPGDEGRSKRGPGAGRRPPADDARIWPLLDLLSHAIPAARSAAGRRRDGGHRLELAEPDPSARRSRVARAAPAAAAAAAAAPPARAAGCAAAASNASLFTLAACAACSTGTAAGARPAAFALVPSAATTAAAAAAAAATASPITSTA